MTTVQFYGGLREIGASKILVSTPDARVLLDIGLPIGAGSELFTGSVRERPGHELADRLRVGQAPAIPALWDPGQLPEGSSLRARDPRPTGVFISHGHLDHIGMAGMVDPVIPLWASPDSVRLCEALKLAGHRFLGGEPAFRTIKAPVRVGDIEVEAIPVNHDVIGACGFLVRTPDGVLGYTGDLNFHRNAGAHSRAFAQQVHGVDMLVTETTMLSFDTASPSGVRTELDVLELISQACADAPGLALASVYERDVERCAALIETARDRGRTMVWPGATATALAAMGVPGVVSWDETRPQSSFHVEALAAAREEDLPVRTIGLEVVRDDPAAFLVQLDSRDMPAILDLPIGRGTPWIHAQGEPLGPFMPDWQPFSRWLDVLGVRTVEAGSSGHASVEALTGFVDSVQAGVVVPLHGEHPERLDHDAGRILLPEYGRQYTLTGERIAG